MPGLDYQRLLTLAEAGDGRLSEGAIVACRDGPTFVRKIGRGPPVIVVHGGPGFDHRYLVAPLAALALRRTLVFFDQPGCGLTPAPETGVSAALTFAHFRELASEVAGGSPVGLFAHSWGALVVAAAAARSDGPPLPAFDEGLVVNPVPLTRMDFDAAFNRLLSRAPPDVVEAFFGILMTGGDGVEAMRLALPYYRSRQFAVPVEPFPLAPSTYLAVSGTLGDFDHSAGLSAFRRLDLLVGADDFSGLDLIVPVIAACRATHVLAGVGHFPFFEDVPEFDRIVEAAFS